MSVHGRSRWRVALAYAVLIGAQAVFAFGAWSTAVAGYHQDTNPEAAALGFMLVLPITLLLCALLLSLSLAILATNRGRVVATLWLAIVPMYVLVLLSALSHYLVPASIGAVNCAAIWFVWWNIRPARGLKRVHSIAWRPSLAYAATVSAITVLLAGSWYTGYVVLTPASRYNDLAGLVGWASWTITLLTAWLLFSLSIALRPLDTGGSLALLWSAIVPAFLSILIEAVHPALVVPQMVAVSCIAMYLGWLRVPESHGQRAHRARQL